MPDPLAHHGGALLRAARTVAGLTQADLATRSGVSVRTIRSLERGSVDQPRLASLLALSRAIGLNPTDRERFLRTWSRPPATPLGELTGRGPALEAALKARTETRATMRTISLTAHVVVGLEGRIEVSRYEAVVTAETDDVSTYLWIEETTPSREATDLVLTHLHNCRLDQRVIIDDGDVVAFDLAFDRLLRRGQRHRLGWWLSPTRTASRTGLEPETHVLVGSRNGFGVLTIEVTFTERRPTRVWRFEGLDRTDETHDVDLDPSGSVLWVGTDVPPGSFGIAWVWD